MHKLLLPAATAVFVLFGAPSISQTPISSTSSVKLTVEQGHIIKEIVLKDFNYPKAPAGTEVKVGAPVPGNVTLQSFPDQVSSKVSQVKSHKFFIAGDRIVVVDPKDNTVADVLD